MPKGPLTDEQKERMAEGRRRARAARKANPVPQSVLSMADAFAERRARLLAGVDPETAALITDDELEQIDREERAKAEAQRKKEALAAVRARVRTAAQTEADLIPASVLADEATAARMNETVEWRAEWPREGSGHNGPLGPRINGGIYESGMWHKTPRHVFDSINSNHYATWYHELAFATLNQNIPGNSAREILARSGPRIEVRNAH